MTMKHVIDKIAHILKTTRGLSQKGLAAHMGLDPAAVNRILHGQRKIMFEEVPLIEEYLGVRLDLLAANEYKQEGTRPHKVSDVRAPVMAQPVTKPVPVYGYAAGSLQKGLNLANGEVVDWVTRHPAQIGIPDAFAIYVFSDSMEPRYFRGELVYVHPGRPPEMNRDCIIEMNNGDAYIKRYLRQTDDKIRVAQFNPPEEKEIAKNDVKAIYAVVGRG
jgi:phage repressor protein C with HTH and peptisase S24 domain